MVEFPIEERVVRRRKRPKLPKMTRRAPAVTMEAVIQRVYEEAFPALSRDEVKAILDKVWVEMERGMMRLQPIVIPRIGRLEPYYTHRGTGISEETYAGPKVGYRLRVRPALGARIPANNVYERRYLYNVRSYLIREYGENPDLWPDEYAWARP